MKIQVLGSSAGGGLPQWNCGGEFSMRARRGDAEVPARSQPSIAVSADGERWSLINASPDIRDQFAGFEGLYPREGTRDIPLDAVIVTNADIDHSLGLLVLRESLPHRVVSTEWVRRTILDNNAAWRLAEPVWGAVELDQPFPLDRRGVLEAQLFPVPGKVPGYLSGLATNCPETTVGVRITDTRTGKRLCYAAGIQSYDAETLSELSAADCRFLDGTFFTAKELLALRPDAADAHAMGHLPVSGPGGSLEILSSLAGTSIYIHINNTNPMVDAGSEAAALVRKHGVEIAYDGMAFEL
ncbi:MAG: pyrroloquinoline quinone biosynthesis protein PqqB [Myxococcota bacterium]|nr:pyrroloquinoline quinone biosynthesis protein PqqB [Myxococcota bacterium]